jgi:hypothetical protein
LAETARVELGRWITEQASAGWKISTGEVVVSGFPLRIVMTLSAPAVEDPTGNVWRGPSLSVSLPLTDPQRPHLEAAGQHVFTLNGHDPLAIAAEGFSADLSIDGHSLDEASIALVTASIGTVHIGRLDFQLHRLAVGHVEHSVPSWGLALSLENLALPDNAHLLFGSLVPAARLETHLQGSLSGGPLPQALAAWRDDGGTLEIDSLSVDWPPLALSGKGTLALDRDLQPILASSCNVLGLFEAIDVLSRNGIVRAQDAGLVKLVFGLMMKPGRDGAQTLTVPLTVQNRTLSIGPAKLFQIPALVW